MPLGLRLMEPLLSRAYADGAGGLGFPVLRLLTSVIFVALPAVAMGATFPLVARWYVPAARAATRDAGALYAANTIGAALGALATGFLLLPTLGLRGTTWVGVAMNVVVAGAAWSLAARSARASASAEDAVVPAEAGSACPRPERPRAPARRRARRRSPQPAPPWRRRAVPRPLLAAVALGVSGFLSLALQIVWSRLLAQILGPTTYAFSLVVAIFITGLALGALLGRRLADRAAQPAAGLAAVLAAAVIAVAISAFTIDGGLRAMAEAVAAPQATFESVLLRQVLLVSAWLLPLALALGLRVPAGDQDRHGPRRVARLRPGPHLRGEHDWRHRRVAGGRLRADSRLGPARQPARPGHRGHRRPPWRWCWPPACAAARACGRWRRARSRPWRRPLLPAWNPALMSSGAYKYASSMSPEALQVSLAAGPARLLQGRRRGHRVGARGRRHDLARHRRQGGRVERRRHAHPAPAGARAAAAAPGAAPRGHSRASAAA